MNKNAISTALSKSAITREALASVDPDLSVTAEKNLLLRFSCSLVQNGKRVFGHKILLQSLFLLRQNYGPFVFLNDKKPENFEKNIRQFKMLSLRKSCFSLFPSFLLAKNSTRFSAAKKKDKISSEKTTKNKEKYILFDPEHEIFDSKSPLSKSLCIDCVQSVQPVLETRKVRKGRVTYKVPKVSSLQRQKGKAIAILKKNAASRKKGDLKNLKTYYSGSSFPDFFLEKSVETQAENEISFLSLPPHRKKESTTQNKVLNGKKYENLSAPNKLPSAKGDGMHKQQGEDPFLFSNNTLQRNHFLYSQRKPILKDCLSEEFFESGNERGESIEKKKQLHLLALQNRAYLHFRWW